MKNIPGCPSRGLPGSPLSAAEGEVILGSYSRFKIHCGGRLLVLPKVALVVVLVVYRRIPLLVPVTISCLDPVKSAYNNDGATCRFPSSCMVVSGNGEACGESSELPHALALLTPALFYLLNYHCIVLSVHSQPSVGLRRESRSRPIAQSPKKG